MNHELSSTLLTDLLAGRIEGEQAAAAWAHVGSCPQCQEIASTIHRLRSALRSGEEAAASRFAAAAPSRTDSAETDPLADHPPSDDLVAFALGDGGIELDALARIRLHVEACDPCREAVALTRQADAATGRGFDWARLLDGLRPGSLVPRLAPALAVLAVLLAYPAWLGLARYPAATREAERTRQELADAEARARAQRAPRPTGGEAASGGVRLLYLRPSLRGAGAPPAVSPRPQSQPVALEFDLGPIAARRPAPEVRLEIRDRSTGVSRWSLGQSADRLWDPVNRLVVFLVPAAVLRPGEYVLELRVPGRSEPTFASPFIVEPTTP